MPIEWLLYPALGVIAGLLAGLLGVGGGLVLVGALALLLPHQGVPREIAMQAALATSLASVPFWRARFAPGGASVSFAEAVTPSASPVMFVTVTL